MTQAGGLRNRERKKQGQMKRKRPNGPEEIQKFKTNRWGFASDANADVKRYTEKRMTDATDMATAREPKTLVTMVL